MRIAEKSREIHPIRDTGLVTLVSGSSFLTLLGPCRLPFKEYLPSVSAVGTMMIMRFKSRERNEKRKRKKNRGVSEGRGHLGMTLTTRRGGGRKRRPGCLLELMIFLHDASASSPSRGSGNPFNLFLMPLSFCQYLARLVHSILCSFTPPLIFLIFGCLSGHSLCCCHGAGGNGRMCSAVHGRNLSDQVEKCRRYMKD